MENTTTCGKKALMKELIRMETELNRAWFLLRMADKEGDSDGSERSLKEYSRVISDVKELKEALFIIFLSEFDSSKGLTNAQTPWNWLMWFDKLRKIVVEEGRVAGECDYE